MTIVQKCLHRIRSRQLECLKLFPSGRVWDSLFRNQETGCWIVHFTAPLGGRGRAVLDAQDTECGRHPGSPPPALVCRVVPASALA